MARDRVGGANGEGSGTSTGETAYENIADMAWAQRAIACYERGCNGKQQQQGAARRRRLQGCQS